MTDHPILVSWSDEDQTYIADIPALQGCTADGKTSEDALRQVLVVKDLWLDVAREGGRPLPAPGRRLVEVG